MTSGTCSWLTNEEVVRGVSEGYVLIGDEPPPIRFETEDDEMLEQFGESIRAQRIPCDNQPPDLKGIASMLRMVQSSDDDDEVTVNSVKPSNCVIAISKPSSLNPNVKEFVPKSCSSSSFNIIENIKCVDKTEVKVNTASDKPCDDKKHVSSVKPNVNNIAETLKNEINFASKSSEIKEGKNVAISTLLKFYETNDMKINKSLKLITPDFYENCNEPPKTEENLKTHSLNLISNKSNISTTRSCSIVQSEPTVLNEKDTTIKSTIHSDDTDMKKSIDKVNQWLDAPGEINTSTIYLGPIAFKRKEVNRSDSPSSSIDQHSKTESKQNQPSQYKPSTYAADLGKKYMAQNKVKKSQKVNMWRDLDLILKEKDATLKNSQNHPKEHNDFETVVR